MCVPLCLFVRVCLSQIEKMIERVPMCVCACVRAFVYVYVCMCLRERESEKERERETETEREIERDSARKLAGATLGVYARECT